MLTTSEKIRLIIKRRNTTIKEVSESLGHIRQNLSNKLKVDDFKESDLKQIANALNCDIKIIFVDRDTNEEI